nr:monovalent cation/H+ antiporter subunit A [Gemmatimonadales bacterium]
MPSGLLAIVLLPFAGSLLPFLARRLGWGPTATTWIAAAGPLAGVALLAGYAPGVIAGGVVTARWPWVPALGLDLSLRLDGLSLLFALLVLGMGLLIVLYARYYMGEADLTGRFFPLLLLFMGSMTGLVLGGNLLLLAVFWELTSVSSFLLIAYHTGSQVARRAARMALVVTGGGGLALLGGLLLLGAIAGTYELEGVLAAGERVTSHALYPPMLGLILLGAFTKSAQLPFHVWLPEAMAAPTPVSAYLHSATM